MFGSSAGVIIVVYCIIAALLSVAWWRITPALVFRIYRLEAARPFLSVTVVLGLIGRSVVLISSEARGRRWVRIPPVVVISPVRLGLAIIEVVIGKCGIRNLTEVGVI